MTEYREQKKNEAYLADYLVLKVDVQYLFEYNCHILTSTKSYPIVQMSQICDKKYDEFVVCCGVLLDICHWCLIDPSTL